MDYVENRWYPILDQNSAPKSGRVKPMALKRFNRNLILWRTNQQQLVCMEDRCPHKGVQLSHGKIGSDFVQCAYHGLKYNSSGRCTEIPSACGQSKIPESLRASTFPLRELYGFVWLWWGAAAPTTDVPWFAELGTEMDQAPTLSVVYPTRFHRLMESHLDCYHIDHLHRGRSPKFGQYIRSVRCETNGDLLTLSMEFGRNPEQTDLDVTTQLLFPATVLATGRQWKMRNLLASCPIDDDHSWLMARTQTPTSKRFLVGPLLDKLALGYTKWFLLPQDFAVQATQEPRDWGFGADTLATSADQAIAEYWRMLKRAWNKQETEQKNSRRAGVGKITEISSLPGGDFHEGSL